MNTPHASVLKLIRSNRELIEYYSAVNSLIDLIDNHIKVYIENGSNELNFNIYTLRQCDGDFKHIYIPNNKMYPTRYSLGVVKEALMYLKRLGYEYIIFNYSDHVTVALLF